MPDLDETVDVIVAGSGGGITGAYTAAREGLSVALVEATDKFGGDDGVLGRRRHVVPVQPGSATRGQRRHDREGAELLSRCHRRPDPTDLQEAYIRDGAG